MIYQKVIGGHRDGYASTFAAMTGLKIYRKSNLIQDLKAMIYPKVLFTACIEDGVVSFFVISLLRSFLQKKTIGLMMSPWDCFRPNKVKDIFRRFAFLTLKGLSQVKIICIVPFDVDPRYKRVADYWIYDPEFWDMHVLEERRMATQVVSSTAKNITTGKINLLYLGRANSEKGFDFLAKLFLDNEDLFLKFHLSVVGEVSESSALAATRLRKAGAHVVDEFVSDESMFEFIRQASLLWCCYSPRYDASSGIFGRAIQFNKLPLIRKSSRLVDLAATLGKDVVTIEFGNLDDALLSLKAIDHKLPSLNKEIDTYALYSHANQVFERCMS
jgi:glycosyltransferase involved in cell wall biosynthesis